MIPGKRFQALVVPIFFVLALNSTCKQEMPAVCKQFYDLSGLAREKEFPTYPVNKQLDIYRCAMQMKPPISVWAYDIAKGGEKKIPAVMERLTAEKDEVMQYHLVRLLRVMSEEPYFRGRQDIADQIGKVVSRMRTSPLKTQAQEALNEIEKNIGRD